MNENRNHQRKSVHLPVAYQVGDGSRIEASCRDLSLGGMFIEIPTTLPFGTRIVVMIRLPGLQQEAKVESTVRWTQPTGMGVQFGPMGARETHALTELLK